MLTAHLRVASNDVVPVAVSLSAHDDLRLRFPDLRAIEMVSETTLRLIINVYFVVDHKYVFCG